MSGLKLRNVRKIYSNGVMTIKNLNLTVMDKELFVIAGPSNCGGSDVLRLIAGIEPVTAGEIKLDNAQDILPSHVAMILSNHCLYPQFTVYDNLAFPLRLQKRSEGEVVQTVEMAARYLKLTDVLDELPEKLSEEEQMLVVLGRALVRKPEILLIEEMFKDLDEEMKTKMRKKLAELQKQMQLTIIFVTEDYQEALLLGNRVAILKDGELQQVDTPKVLLEKPVNEFVADFVKSSVVV
jgi:multiple sugar transport system ATP-binding protein